MNAAVESELRDIASEIQSRVADFGRTASSDGSSLHRNAQFLIHLDVDTISNRLISLLGPEVCDRFFREFSHETTATMGLTHTLFRIIPARSTPSFTLDVDGLYGDLKLLANAIMTRDVPYAVRMRLGNIAISEDFQLSTNVRIRNATEEEIQSRYRILHIPGVVEPPSRPEDARLHCVEVVIVGRDTPENVAKLLQVEGEDASVNSLLHSFQLAGIPQRHCATVTHVLFWSPVEGRCSHRYWQGLNSEPYPLTPEDIVKLKETYAFVVTHDSDAVLATATDRFLLGLKQEIQHPNRVNQPHWDKAVDYTIALETILLTSHGAQVEGELSYRFRLNGATLLAQVTGRSKRVCFRALKALYELRSKVVHGSPQSTTLKAANKFIDELNIDDDNHKHPLGRLMLICREVERMLRLTLTYLHSIPAASRPYNATDGWEEMLWNPRKA